LWYIKSIGKRINMLYTETKNMARAKSNAKTASASAAPKVGKGETTYGKSANGFDIKTTEKSVTYAWPATIKFARLHSPDTKYVEEGQYAVIVDIDDKVEADVQAAGIQSKLLTGDKFDGCRKFYYNVNKMFDTQPVVKDEDGVDIEGYSIGEGTTCTVYVATYETSLGTGQRLMGIKVDNLVLSDFEPGSGGTELF